MGFSHRPWIVLVLLGLTGSVMAGPREESVEILESVNAIRDPARFEVWLNEARSEAKAGERVSLVVGQPQHYHIVSAANTYLVTIHINAHGVATLLFPATSASGNLAEAGVRKDFPRDPVYTEPPLGDDDLFVFGTRQPLTRKDLGLGDLRGDYPMLDEDDVPTIARKLREKLDAQPSGSVVAARVRSTVFGRSGVGTRGLHSMRPAYTVEDIINYFMSLKTRGLRRPRLDAQIRFETNQVTLTDQARVNLDVFGEALRREELSGFVFALGGHTDLDGDEAYNEELSRRRAQAVREYLVKQHKNDQARLETKAYGESEPLRNDDSAESKAMNRRVEFRLER